MSEGQAVPIATIHNANNRLKRMAADAREIVALEEAVAKFGSLSQAAAETEQRLAQLQADELKLQSDHAANVAAAHSELAQKRGAIDQHDAELTKRSEEVIEAAREKAAQMVADGAARAAELVADARAQLRQLTQDIADSNSSLLSLGRQVEEVRASLGELQAQRDSAQAQLDEINRAREELRSRL